MKNPPIWIVTAGWAALLAAGLAADVPVSRWVHDSGLSGFLKAHHPWVIPIRLFGNYFFYSLVAAVMLVIASRTNFPAAIFVLLASLTSALDAPLKCIAGRYRPYQPEGFGPFDLHPFATGWWGLIGWERGMSFASGDVFLAAATSTCLAVLFPKWRWPLAAIVVIVAIERVAEGAHYPSDTVAGALLGWSMALLVWRWLGKPRVLRGESDHE